MFTFRQLLLRALQPMSLFKDKLVAVLLARDSIIML